MNMYLVVLLAILGGACAKDYCYCLTGNRVNVRSYACGRRIGSANKGECFKDLGSSRNCKLNGKTYRYRKIRFNSKNGWIAANYLTRRQCPTVNGSWNWKNGTCNDTQLVSRAEWRAKSATIRHNMRVPVSKLFIHHTGGRRCTTQSTCEGVLRGMQKFHMKSKGQGGKGWWDIAYNWLVGEDGRAYEGRGWRTAGAHTPGHNYDAVAITVMGHFSGVSPGARAKSAIENLIDCAVKEGVLRSNYKMFGHRDVDTTDCPGDALYAEVRRHPHYSSRKP